MIDIREEFFKTGMLLDKTTQSLTAFPYDLDDIKIKANDYVTDISFNDAIQKLHYNFLYIYRGCNVGNFEVFDSYYYTLSSISSPPYYKKSENEYSLMTTLNGLITSTHTAIILPYNESQQSSYLFMADNGYITCFKTGIDVFNLIFKTNNVDPLSGDIKFKNITNIASDFKDNFYVVDSSYNSIFQYNVNNFVSNEFIYREKLFLKNLIGGTGSASDNNKFNGILNVAVNENILVAQDVNNKCFKIFDKNLNWKNTASFNKIFDMVGFFDSILLDDKNNLYGAKDTKIYKFNLFEDAYTYEYENAYDLGNYFVNDERILGMHVIPSNKNLFYIQTNKSIKKVWFSSLNYVLGQFNYNNGSNRNLKWMSVASFDGEQDFLVLYCLNTSGTSENLSFNLDRTYYNTLLNFENISIYELTEMLIDKDEYVQSWVLLSKLSKLYYNCFALLQNIKYKYKEIENIDYPIIDKKIYNKGFLGFLNSLDYDKNFNIGVNEIFQSEVINRALKEIYTFQLTILLYIVNNESDKKYLSPDPFINNPTSKKFTYYVDDSFILVPNPITLNIFEELGPGAGILVSLGGAPLTSDDTISIQPGVNI